MADAHDAVEVAALLVPQVLLNVRHRDLPQR